MKRLFRVETLWYVMAENYDEAEAGYGVDLQKCALYARPAQNCIAAEWEDAPPFGGDDDRTCSQILGDEQLAKEEKNG